LGGLGSCLCFAAHTSDLLRGLLGLNFILNLNLMLSGADAWFPIRDLTARASFSLSMREEAITVVSALAPVPALLFVTSLTGTEEDDVSF
jgi:hypothetical protein